MLVTCHLAPAFLDVFARYATQKHRKSLAASSSRYAYCEYSDIK